MSLTVKSSTPSISFVIPVLNDAKGLERCLESIEKSVPANVEVEVVVADNGSADDSVAVASRHGAIVLCVPDVSVAELRNRAAAAARGAILAFVDADHEIGEDWCEVVLEAMTDPEIGAIGAPYDPPPGATWVQRANDHLRDHREGRSEVRWLGSGNLAIRRAAFEKVCGFDERLVTCEDVDLCARVRASGCKIVSDRRAASVHHGDPCTLRQLFIGELWRGQDNLRVSMRQRLSLADLPGIFLPMAVLVSLVSVIGGLVLSSPSIIGGGIAVFLSSTALRVGRLLSTGSALPVSHAVAVAATYETARALALVVRVPHRRADAIRRGS